MSASLPLAGVRVCVATAEYPPAQGGAGVSCARVCRALAAAGATVHAVTRDEVPGAHGDVARGQDEGVELHRLRHEQPFSQAALFAFRQYLRQLDAALTFDVFQGIFLNETFPLLHIAGSRPVVGNIQGDDVLRRIDHPLWRSQILAVARKATWIVSVNQAFLDRVGEEADVAGRSSVIYTASPGVPPGPAWHLSEENRGTVGTSGEFRKVKDIPLLVRAFAALAPEARRTLLLTGYFNDPPEERWTRTLIAEFGLEDRVRLTGRLDRDGVGRWLRAMHVYVQPSASEGLPNALLEAAALGVPLVATAVGGMREVLENGRSALLVPHGDVRALTAAIEGVLTNDGLASRLSAGARALAETLSPGREAAAWTALYARLLERSR